jgi:hypothetical protein
MADRKRYEVLEALPTYGGMYLAVTAGGEPFYSEGYVVRFFKTDGSEWDANFETGWADLAGVYELDSTAILLVIAYGACYLMNPDETKPVSAFGAGYVSVLKAEDGRLILQGGTSFTIIETDGTCWHTVDISWDGLKDLKLKHNIVSGLSYEPRAENGYWDYFEYDLTTKILTGGSYPRNEIV